MESLTDAVGPGVVRFVSLVADASVRTEGVYAHAVSTEVRNCPALVDV